VIALACVAFLVQDAVSTTGYGSAHWRIPSGTPAVGEPFEAVLIVPHARSDQIALDAAALEDDPTWVILEPPRAIVHARADWLAPEESAFAWTLASLEAGEREMPAVSATLTLAEGELALVHSEPASATFAGVLAPEEDAPREPLGFAPIAEEATARAWLPWTIGGAAALALAGAGLAISLARRARRARLAPPPTFAQRLADLERRDLDSREVAREIHYELTRLVRGEIDSRTGSRRDALTDDEWLREVARALDSERTRELEALLRASEAVKYGAHAPTPWAVRETIERARRAANGAREPAEAAR
jgi:hypothetical protein